MQVQEARESDPWLHGFSVWKLSSSDSKIASIGFKGRPDVGGIAEFAYQIDETQQGKGYAAETLEGIVQFALSRSEASLVRAHTLPEKNASTSVLKKCHFQFVGEVTDPEDGQVWRWERGQERTADQQSVSAMESASA